MAGSLVNAPILIYRPILDLPLEYQTYARATASRSSAKIVAKGIYPALIGSDIVYGVALHSLGRIPCHLTPE